MTPDNVAIIDYKTDRGQHAKPEYRKQVSVYYLVLSQCFPDREISASIFYTEDGSRVSIDPLTKEELVALVRAEMATSSTIPAG